jgi:superfamily I DNA/RNA helicase
VFASNEFVVEPIAEQQIAVQKFLVGDNLRIDAYAGAGKTTTLKLLAMSKRGRALYLAFNRSIAAEARLHFPAHVSCATTHSIAYRGVRSTLSYPEWKLTTPLTPNLILEAFRLPTIVSFRCGLEMEQRSYAAVLLEGIRRFLQSKDESPAAAHVPWYGVLESLSPQAFESFAEQATGHLNYLWAAMLDRSQRLPLGHDGYLKLWSMSRPQAKADYIMVDEAQDLNPVLLDVLDRADCQVVYVGDQYQQIYEWRGAVNAMAQIHAGNRCLLSQSFRFGPEIASAATFILRTLGAGEPLRGSTKMTSRIGPVRPNALLSRSNAGVIGNVLYCLSRNIRCAVLGGTNDLSRVLTDVQRLKAGQPAQSAELVGFQSWRDVMRFSSRAEGGMLRALVNQVQEHGEDRMLRALGSCEATEATSQVVCSTAHRSKGREWDNVRLDRDFEAGFARAERQHSNDARAALAPEARLFYVALTRARVGVQIAPEVARRFGIRDTSTEAAPRRTL